MNADLETQIIELNNNPAFCALREKFAQDTIFDILGATNRELVNSRFFAWLLDSNGFHNLGTKGVEKLFECIKEIIKQDSLYIPTEKEIKSVNVFSEKAFKNCRFDILLSVEYARSNCLNSEKLLIAIENKYDSKEFDKQTKKYSKRLSEIKSQGHFDAVIGIFLSKHSDKAKSKNFINIDYDKYLKDVIANISQPVLKTDVRSNLFINEYLHSQNVVSPNVFKPIKRQLENILNNECANEHFDFLIENRKLILAYIKTTTGKFEEIKKLLTEKAGQIIKRMVANKLKSFDGNESKIEDFLVKTKSISFCPFAVFNDDRLPLARYYKNTIPHLSEFKDIKGIETLKDYYFTNHWFEKDIEKMRKWLDEYRPGK